MTPPQPPYSPENAFKAAGHPDDPTSVSTGFCGASCIFLTRDWRKLLAECAEDLSSWHAEWEAIDWPASLRQPDWLLLTDAEGSWCLLHPYPDDPAMMMGHVIIAADCRGRDGLVIGRAMLDWISLHVARPVVATVTERRTAIYLRWLGFEWLQPNMLIWNGSSHSTN